MADKEKKRGGWKYKNWYILRTKVQGLVFDELTAV